MALNFQLISAGGVKYDGEAHEVIIPTKDGTIAVFEDHMPLLSAGVPGILSVRKKAGDSDDSMENFAVFGGILQAEGNSARFISEAITAADEVSEQEAHEAFERAKKLVDNADSREALREAQAAMYQQSARLNLAKLKKRRHN